jgi:hypothetical protein
VRRRLLTALAVSALLGAAFPSIAGAVSLTWSVHAYQDANDVAAAPGGGVYVVGGRDTSITRKAFVARYTPGSTRAWTRSWLPNVDSSTNGVAVAVGGDGRVYVLGSVQQQCEGGGWFVRAYSPSGDLLDKYVTPGWQCSLLEHPTDLAVDGNLVVVTGFTHGCCADQTRDGWAQALSRSLSPRWRTDVEPPATPASWFDTASSSQVTSPRSSTGPRSCRSSLGTAVCGSRGG